MLALCTLLAWLAIGCGGSSDTRPAKWSFISASITEPSCASANCHSNLSQRSGVELDAVRVGYFSLVCRNFVIPGNPTDQQPLIGLIEGQGSRRMPPDVPLPQADITLIANWIGAGAQWDGPGADPCTDAGTGN